MLQCERDQHAQHDRSRGSGHGIFRCDSLARHRPGEGVARAGRRGRVPQAAGRAVGATLDGIVGTNVLRRFRLTIDYPAVILRLM